MGKMKKNWKNLEKLGKNGKKLEKEIENMNLKKKLNIIY